MGARRPGGDSGVSAVPSGVRGAAGGVGGQAGLAGRERAWGVWGCWCWGRGFWGPTGGLGSPLGLREAGGDAETRVRGCLRVMGMERCCRDLGMGGSGSRRCFVRQGGCRMWKEGVWWLAGDDGKDGYSEGRRLELAGAQGPVDGDAFVFCGWRQGRRWSVRGWGWRRFGIS